MTQYAIFKRPFQVENMEQSCGRELVTINLGCCRPVKEKGLFKKKLYVDIPTKLYKSSQSIINDSISFEELVKRGIVEPHLFTKVDIEGMKGVSSRKWKSSLG